MIWGRCKEGGFVDCTSKGEEKDGNVWRRCCSSRSDSVCVDNEVSLARDMGHKLQFAKQSLRRTTRGEDRQ